MDTLVRYMFFEKFSLILFFNTVFSHDFVVDDVWCPIFGVRVCIEVKFLTKKSGLKDSVSKSMFLVMESKVFV